MAKSQPKPAASPKKTGLVPLWRQIIQPVANTVQGLMDARDTYPVTLLVADAALDRLPLIDVDALGNIAPDDVFAAQNKAWASICQNFAQESFEHYVAKYPLRKWEAAQKGSRAVPHERIPGFAAGSTGLPIPVALSVARYRHAEEPIKPEFAVGILRSKVFLHWLNYQVSDRCAKYTSHHAHLRLEAPGITKK